MTITEKKIEMPAEAEWIIKKIQDSGFEAFAVGGCVRDSLLGRMPEDWDITTSARPEEVKKIFGKTIDTGLQHGTVTILKNHKGYEVTTYRIDGEYHDGRHPDSVEFTASLTEDLKRRDFTINAMAYSHETGIVDEFGGITDLEKGIIRCVGCAHDRFTEDALRILRAIRFCAQLGFSIEEKTKNAIASIAPNLAKVSKERIQTELTKLLLSDHPEQILMVKETGISQYVTEEFPQAFKSWIPASLKADPNPPLQSLSALRKEKSVRWAGFLKNLTPDHAVNIIRGLKLDNETADNVRVMVRLAQTDLPPQKPAIRRQLSKVTLFQFEGAMELKTLSGDPKVPEILRLRDEILASGDCISLKTLAVNGSDLIKAGVTPGKEMGALLTYLLDQVLETPESNQKAHLLSLITPPSSLKKQ